MKKIIIVLVAIIAIVFIASRFITISSDVKSNSTSSSTESNGKLQDSQFQKEYLSKPGLTVVNIWATWCKPCIEEMPLLDKIKSENEDVNFVFLSIDEDENKLKVYLSKHAINDITFQNKEYVTSIREFLGGKSLLGLNAIPETYILKDGKVVDKIVGGIDYNELTTKLKSLK